MNTLDGCKGCFSCGFDTCPVCGCLYLCKRGQKVMDLFRKMETLKNEQNI